MSEGVSNSFDPYQPPVEPGYTDPSGPAPKGIKFVAICALILGLFGILSCVQGAFGLAFNIFVNPALQQNMAPPSDDPAAKAQLEMQQEINKIQRQYLVPNILALLLKAPLAIGLMIGGIGAMKYSQKARKTLLLAFGYGIIFELLNGALAIFLNLKNMEVMKKFMSNVGQADPNAPAEVFETVGNVMSIGVIAIVVVWVLTKVLFYILSLGYMKSDKVGAHFAEA